jgi:NADPH:quinone reductase-like Zn-dependent oxidoreductase
MGAMRAIVYTEYGPPHVLRLADVETPTPGDGEVRVAVRAVGIGFGDLMARDFPSVGLRRFTMPGPLWLPTRLWFGWRRPRRRILGSEFAGVVDAVGAGVDRFRPGDRVFGYLGPAFGALAEHMVVQAAGLVATMPANATFEEAAAIPYGAMTARNLLKKAAIRPAHDVLIIGASGGIGVYALQLARHAGARVTAVCGPDGADMVRSLGAHRVIDHTREDFAGDAAPTGDAYNLVFDIPGRASWARVRPLLRPGGRYLLASFTTRQVLQMLRTAVAGDRKVVCALSMESPADLVEVAELVEAGTIRPVVDRTFPLEEAAEAHRYLEAGHRRGSVVVTVAG